MNEDIVIDRIFPDAGIYRPRWMKGLPLKIRCRSYAHGTERIFVNARWRRGKGRWQSAVAYPAGEDIYECLLPAVSSNELEFYFYSGFDRFGSWIQRIRKWKESGEASDQDIQTGRSILSGMIKSEPARILPVVRKMIRLFDSKGIEGLEDLENNNRILNSLRSQRGCSLSRRIKVDLVPEYGYFSSWYETFPRSQGKNGRHGTFRDVQERLQEISSMGFDTIYFPPIHPIGLTNRRGKNGIMPARSDDPGSPWAIGNENGGHKSVNPDLGTLDDFKSLLRRAEEHGMRIALDLAFQCSPDHPYVKDHPEWFERRPDGSVRYAENPPKKYTDIYPFDFFTAEWRDLWNELKSIVDFWISAGVKIFRVDNPHTKPFSFWKWLMESVHREHPDVVFLSEAFTRSDVMYHLSELGFQMSYTYFTWKNYRHEIESYFTELNSPEISSFFRPMLFTNTPDILTPILQNGGRAAFMLRALLASTLSPLWGIYSGFEICENEAVQGTEEYMDSEKFELKHRDLERPGNIREFISTLNRTRRELKPLQIHGNVGFLECGNQNIIAYSRKGISGEPSVMVVVNINPFETHEAMVRVPEDWNASDGKTYTVRDHLDGSLYAWKGEFNYVKLIPAYRPGHILTLEELDAGR